MDDKKQQQIYGNYRMALKALRGGTAGERKQRAREMIVDRYHISFRDLKEIINREDERNKVTHEHTEAYLKLFKYEQAFDELVLKHKNSPQACFICGTQENTAVRIDPVKRENREWEAIVSCEPCQVNLLRKSLGLK